MMNTLLDTFGTSLTKRLLSRVALPGLLFVACCSWFAAAGHARVLDFAAYSSEVDLLWSQTRTAPLALLIAAVSTAIAAGVIASLLGRGVHRVWIMRLSWDDLPPNSKRSRPFRRGGKRWIEWRRQRYSARNRKRGVQPPRNYRPQCTTAIGDAFRLIGTRIDAQYGLSANAAWPRLVLLVNADTRSLVDEAYQRYRSDTILAAWSLLLLPWSALSWPAALIGTAGLVTAHLRARASSTALATIVESVFDVHQLPLAASVGIEVSQGRLTRTEGNHITDILTKRAQTPSSRTAQT
ncbi:hypothetical protein [Glycomyces sp. NPDC047010]|uniref:hypothetical protein n=1 Tax=Glycomyces sp. NPDC047010 TaxID=3155023 RepID=UPI0033C29261